MLLASRELFLAQGFGATTVEQIAERAGVSKPTVFTAVGNKQQILTRLRAVALRGDDEDPTVDERESWQRVVNEPDPYRAVELEVAHVAGLWSRNAELREVLRGAASSGEPVLQELWATEEGQRLIAARKFVDALADKGPLRDGLDREAATDVVWLLTAPENFHALVSVRGWPRARYEQWLTDGLTHVLLSPRSHASARYSTSRTRSRPAR